MKILLSLIIALLLALLSWGAPAIYSGVQTPTQIAMDTQWSDSAGAMARIATRQEGGDWQWLLAMCDVEERSRNSNSFNKHGAVGRCQIKLPTWIDYECKGLPWNAQDSYTCGARIVESRRKKCHGIRSGITSYNVGTSKCPPWRESKHTEKVITQRALMERGM